MAGSSDAEDRLCEVMLSAYGAGDDFDFELRRLCAGYREKYQRDQRDMEIAQLIPHGVEHVIERFGGKKRINQYRAHRGRQLLKLVQRFSP